MISYWAIVSARFRSLLQYRSAALAGLVTQIVWGMIRVMIFQAFYSSTNAEQPMDGSDVETYIWLGQAFLAALPWNIDTDLRSLIRSGGIGYELVRPVDLYSYWLSRALSWRTAPMLMRAIPLLIFAFVVMGMSPPVSWAAAAAFFVSMCAAILLSSAITTFLNVTMLWTITGRRRDSDDVRLGFDLSLGCWCRSLSTLIGRSRSSTRCLLGGWSTRLTGCIWGIFRCPNLRGFWRISWFGSWRL